MRDGTRHREGADRWLVFPAAKRPTSCCERHYKRRARPAAECCRWWLPHEVPKASNLQANRDRLAAVQVAPGMHGLGCDGRVSARKRWLDMTRVMTPLKPPREHQGRKAPPRGCLVQRQANHCRVQSRALAAGMNERADTGQRRHRNGTIGRKTRKQTKMRYYAYLSGRVRGGGSRRLFWFQD